MKNLKERTILAWLKFKFVDIKSLFGFKRFTKCECIIFVNTFTRCVIFLGLTFHNIAFAVR